MLSCDYANICTCLDVYSVDGYIYSTVKILPWDNLDGKIEFILIK